MIPIYRVRKELTNRCAMVGALLVMVACAPARSEQFIATWIGNGGTWNDPLNWECQGPTFNCVPDNGVSTYRVFIDAEQICNLNMSPVIDRIDMFSATTLNQFNNQDLTIVGIQDPPDPLRETGVFSLDGATYIMSSTGSNTDLVAGSGGLIIGTSGQPGTIQLSDSTTNRIFTDVINDPIFIQSNITIQGSGRIGFNRAAITTEIQSTVRATQSQPLILDPAGGWTNSGRLLADGGTLRLDLGTYDNAGGTIEALDASLVELNGSTIVEGTLITQGSGVIRATGNTVRLENLSNLGSFEIISTVDPILVGTITNSSQISMLSTGSLTDLRIDGDVTLTGGGTLTLSDNLGNRLFGLAPTDRLTNAADHTIQGGGQIGDNSMALTNQGLIHANQETRLEIDPSASAMINAGIMQAENGGTLQLLGGVFANNGGTIEALEGGIVKLNASTIVGGTLTTQGTGVIQATGNTVRLEDLTISGSFEIISTVDPILVGTITNSSEIRMLSSGSTTDLRIDGDVTLTGGGSLTLSDNIGNRFFGLAPTDRLTNAEDHTIEGGGQIGDNALALTNQGLINANQETHLEIDPSASNVINNSMMQASNLATLLLQDGTFTNTGGVIRALDGSFVNLNNGTIIGGLLTTVGSGEVRIVGNTSTLQDVANTGLISVNNAVDPRLIGTITNAGIIAMNSSGGVTNLTLASMEVTLTGGGTLSLSDNIGNGITSTTNGFRLVQAADHTIRGAGSLGRNVINLTNNGLINADQSTGFTVDLTEGGGGNFNNATLQASDGSTLTLLSTTLDNTNGVIQALDGSFVDLNNGTIIRGLLTTVGSGEVRIVGNTTTLQDVTNTGVISVINAIDPILVGTIINRNEIRMLSTGGTTDLRIDSDVTLTGGGVITMTDVLGNRIFATSGDLTLSNVDNTIRGAGQIGINQTTIVNQGTIIADQSTALKIDPSDSGGCDNQGALRAEGAGGLEIAAGIFTNSGDVFAATGSTITRTATDYSQTGGSTIVDGSLNLNASGVVTIDGGTFGGAGQVNANVECVAGMVAPGSSTGTLTINGDYTQGTGTSMAVEVGGMIPGTEHDVVAVAGTATLSGSLAISFANGFIPAKLGDSFTILTAATVTGQFDQVTSPVFGDGLRLQAAVTPIDVRLVVVPAADLNSDGAVDLLDFSRFSVCFAGPGPAVPGSGCDPASFAMSDMDSDGDVDLVDYNIFFASFFGF